MTRQIPGVCLLFFIQGVLAAPPIPELFTPNSLVHKRDLPPYIAQQQELEVNLSVLTSLRTDQCDQVKLVIMDQPVVFHKTDVRLRIHNTTWVGKNKEKIASAVLTLGNDHLFGHVFLDGRFWFLEPAPTPGRAICLLRNALPQPIIDPEILRGTDSELEKHALSPQQGCQPGSQIDFLALYTSGMAQQYGEQVMTRIQYQLDYVNEAFDNSDIDSELVLVYTEEVDYPDYSPDPDGDVSDCAIALWDMVYLQGTHNPGVFDHVEDLRTEFGADYVLLIRRFRSQSVGPDGVVCGVSPGVLRSTRAYCVVQDGGFCAPSVFAHEFGHGLGCAHDRCTVDRYPGSGGAGIFGYSYGYQEPSGDFCTIMAYDWTCACSGPGCPTIPHYSSPQITFNGQVTGVDADSAESADNARTIRETKASMAQFRNRILGSKLPEIYTAPQVFSDAGENTMLHIVNPGNGTATMELYAFSVDGNVLGSKAMTVGVNHKKTLDLATTFGSSVSRSIAWVQVGSNLPLDAVVELRTPTVSTAYRASHGLTTGAFVPHVAKNTAQFETMIAGVNASPYIIENNISPEPFGDTRDLGIACPYTQNTSNALDLFGGDIEIVDWAELDSDYTALAAMEYFSYLPQRSKVASLGLDDSRSPTLRFLHVAADVAQFWTGLVYMNVGDSTITVIETYYGADGSVITSESVNLIRGEKRTLLFDQQNTEPEGTVWMEVRTDTSDLVGYELFGAANTSQHDYFAGLQGNARSGRDLIFPHAVSSSTSWTGIVALNVGAQISDIRFEAMDEQGQVLESYTEPDIHAGVKVVKTVASMFSESTRSQLSWVRARATDSDWSGFLLWGDLADPRQTLSGVVASTP